MLYSHVAVPLVVIGLVIPIVGCNGHADTKPTTGGARGAFTGSGGCTCPNNGTDCLLSCPDGTDGSCADGQPSCSSTKVDAGTTSALQWYVTCGAPVCEAPVDGGSSCVADSPTCPEVGTSCTTKGQTCNDCAQSCGARIVCDDHDPKGGVGGCPISSRKFKDNIEYLGRGDLQRLHDEAMRLRLATYQYKNRYGSPDETHLGFIIEDNPQSLAVDRGHDRVDIYGYMSMLAASLQVQEQEIKELRRELASCKR